jgi:large subunit ribosomal protein L10
MQRQAVREKAENVKEIRELIQKYDSIGIANLYKVRASQLQELRKKLWNSAYLRVIKNSLMERAIPDSKAGSSIKELKEYVKGSNLFLFTNLNPFKLALILERSKIKAIAKAGDIASEDVVVPAGNTGLPPGPIISQLGSVGIPTRIESGSVWVNRDTVVAKEGETISQSLAPILSKLGIKAVEMGLRLKVVYDNGVIIPENQLDIDLNEYKKNLSEAYAQAMNLSLNAAVPTSENIAMLVQIATAETYNLAFNAGIPTPETISDLLRKAHHEALALSKITSKQ